MFECYRSLIVRQYEAALRMLHECIAQCEGDAWDATVSKLLFCQVAYHTCFFTDVYLVDDIAAMKAQPFHREHAGYFADYEELSPRHLVSKYDRTVTLAYVQHCRELAGQVLGRETESSLAQTSQLPWMGLNRAELHVYNIRHVHHHAAQLSLHLKQAGSAGSEWVGSGWDDLD